MAPRCRGAPLPPPLPGTPTAAGLAADSTLPPSGAARQTGCLLRYPSRSCPCATTPLAVKRAQPHCWLAGHPRPWQRSTALPTTSPTPERAPLLSGPGSPGHAAVVAPAELGAGSAFAATPFGRTRLLGSDRVAREPCDSPAP